MSATRRSSDFGGSVETLDEMVRKMAKHQLGKKLEPQEVNRIVAFLTALTGEIPAEYCAEPAMPGAEGKAGKGKAEKAEGNAMKRLERARQGWVRNADDDGWVPATPSR